MSEQPEPMPVQQKKTRIIASDTMLLVVDHCESKTACVVSSALVQGFGRIVSAQGLVREKILLQPEPPIFRAKLKENIYARQALAGVLTSLYALAQMFPENFEFADHRTEPPRIEEIPEAEELVEEATGSYAEGVSNSAILAAPRIIGPDGRELRAA